MDGDTKYKQTLQEYSDYSFKTSNLISPPRGQIHNVKPTPAIEEPGTFGAEALAK